MPATGNFPAARSSRASRSLRRSRANCTKNSASRSSAPIPGSSRIYAYPHATVRLHFFRVRAWQGEPHGKEAAAACVAARVRARRWRRCCRPTRRCCARCSFRSSTRSPTRARSATQQQLSASRSAPGAGPAVDPGARERHAGARAGAFRRAVIAMARAYGARVLINADIELAQRLGADGVHLTAAQLARLERQAALRLVRRLLPRCRGTRARGAARGRFRGARPGAGDADAPGCADAGLGRLWRAGATGWRCRCSRWAGCGRWTWRPPGAAARTASPWCAAAGSRVAHWLV